MKPCPGKSGWGFSFFNTKINFTPGHISFLFPPTFHILQIISGFCVFMQDLPYIYFAKS